MVSVLETLASKQSMQAKHPLRWGRAVGPLLSYAAFFLLATLGGLTAHNHPKSTTSSNTMATAIAITPQLATNGVKSSPWKSPSNSQ